MSTIELIYNEEIQNLDMSILHPEGVFYKAYEHSAYILSMNVKPFKPNKRLYKHLGKDVVSVGFPKSSLEKYMSGQNVEYLENGILRVHFDYRIDYTSFELWKQSVPLSEVKSIDTKVCTERTQVYIDSYDFLLRIHKLIVNISKDSKKVLGKNLEDSVFNLVRTIHKSNLKKEIDSRLEMLGYALDIVDDISLTIRILKDLQEISIKHYLVATERLELINNQIIAWEKYTQKQKSQTS